MLFEGAQAALLDLDHGTYPFVTSSNPVAGAACVGAGVGPTDIDEVWGVCKAYTTRVGAGPFPTELTTRSAPTCATAATSSAPPPGASAAAAGSTWSRCATRPGSTGSRRWRSRSSTCSRGSTRCGSRSATAAREGAVFDEFPYHQSILHTATAEYEEMPGWEEDISGARSEAELPPEARDYLAAISEGAGVPIRLVGVGPGREQVIRVDEQALRAA